MLHPTRPTKVLACSAIALLASALAACSPVSGKNPVPDPVPDHGPAAATPGQMRIYLSVHDISNARTERIVVGTAQAFGYDGKPITIRDEKTGAMNPAITPFKLRSIDGEAYVMVNYFPNTAYVKVSVILQGRGGDSMLMEITDLADNIMRVRGDGADYCEIIKPIGTLGACTTYADVVTTL